MPRTLQGIGEPRRHGERRLLILPSLHRAGCKENSQNLTSASNCKNSGDPVLGGGDRNSAHAGKTTIEQKIVPKCKDALEKERLFMNVFFSGHQKTAQVANLRAIRVTEKEPHTGQVEVSFLISFLLCNITGPFNMGPLQHNIRRNAHIPSVLQSLQQVARSRRPLQQSICLQHKPPFCQNHKARDG